jgi:hypothetical protein
MIGSGARTRRVPRATHTMIGGQTHQSTTMLKYLICCAAHLAMMGAPNAQSADNVALSLTRQYGRALYRDCRLDVTVFERQGRTALQCTFNSDPPRSLHAQRPLTPQEVAAVSALVRAGDLCSGGHIGRDTRASDGELETLLTACSKGHVAVLVTSGNPTFQTNDARRQLLARLHAVEAELQKAAPLPK